MKKIDKKIVGYEVVKDPTDTPPAEDAPKAEQKAEPAQPDLGKRPEQLSGTTYKVKAGEAGNIYVTINDVVLEDGRRFAYELFINAKDVGSAQWVAALSLTLTAVLRQSRGNVEFLAEELGQVFDPVGGWWDKGRRVPSIPAAIGDVLKKHLQNNKAHNEALEAGYEPANPDMEVAVAAEADEAPANEEPEATFGKRSVGAAEVVYGLRIGQVCSQCSRGVISPAFPGDTCGACPECGASKCSG